MIRYALEFDERGVQPEEHDLEREHARQVHHCFVMKVSAALAQSNTHLIS